MELFDRVKELIASSSVKITDEDLRVVVSLVVQAQEEARINALRDFRDEPV